MVSERLFDAGNSFVACLPAVADAFPSMFHENMVCILEARILDKEGKECNNRDGCGRQ